MQMPFKALFYFEATARYGSYSEAARHLNVSHGAVLAQVNKLEAWLELRLFEKHNNKLILNDNGIKLAESLNKSFKQIESAILDIKQEYKQTIIISIIPSLATHFLLPNLNQFNNQNPDINFELHYCLNGFYHPDSHFVIGYNDHTMPSNKNSHYLFSGETIPVCSKEYLNHSNHLTPLDLSSYILLHDGNKTAWKNWFSDHATQNINDKIFDKGVIYSDFNMLFSAILRGNGVGLCPKFLLQEEIALGRIIILSNLSGNKDRYYCYFINKPCKTSTQEIVINWLNELAKVIQTTQIGE